MLKNDPVHEPTGNDLTKRGCDALLRNLCQRLGFASCSLTRGAAAPTEFLELIQYLTTFK